MRLLPKFPTIGKIPEFAASQRAIEFITINAALGAIFFGIFNSWIIAFICLAFIAYQYLLIHRQKAQKHYSENTSFALPKLSKLVLFCLLIGCIGLILAIYGGQVSSRPATALLCVLMGLKLLEARDIRGYAITCLLMYFLAAITFSYENSSIAMLGLLLYCLTTTCCLYLLYQPQSELSVKATLLENSKILVKAIPLTLIIFFLFPRIQGDFGFLPDSDLQGTPGFGDSINAGDLSGSGFSDALAFRVEFEGNKVPARDDLYWRSKVLSVEDNFSWQFDVDQENRVAKTSLRSSAKARPQTSTPLNQNNEISYKVIHQASRDFHIPTLDHVSAVSRGDIFDNAIVRVTKPLKGATSYSATSSLSPFHGNTAKLSNISHYLQTSFKPKRKTTQLLQEWKRTASKPEELITLALNHFRTEPFNYNLKAPTLNPAKPIEDFLFNSRTGYCEHYASVFTTLMRWQGVPARVVIGFQGGDWIPEGSFLEVRYSSAHAWSEVWLQGKGWTRIDPTAAIAPERVQFGMDALLALMDSNQLGQNIGAQKLADMLRPAGISKAFKKVSSLYSSFNHNWDKWVVNFNHDRQLDILEKLKLGKDNAMLKLFAFMVGLCGLVAAYILFRILPKKIPLQPIDKLYQAFLKKLKPLGLEPHPSEAALSFGQRAASKLPEKQNAILEITQLYTATKYGGKIAQTTSNLEILKDKIKLFKPKK